MVTESEVRVAVQAHHLLKAAGSDSVLHKATLSASKEKKALQYMIGLLRSYLSGRTNDIRTGHAVFASRSGSRHSAMRVSSPLSLHYRERTYPRY